jgi:acyl-CoA synthetase (NDP forming)
MREGRADLKTFFNPRSVAIVGVSSDFSKFTGRTLKYLLKHGYKGKVYPINPKYREIVDLPCYPSVADLPEAADIAFIQIREERVMSVLEDCSAKGIRNTVIFSAGLGETGAEGRRKELEIKDFANAHGIRICGPNSVGYVNTINGVALSPVVALELDSLPSGRIGLISQSGGMTGALISRAEARGIGFSYVISTGNESDLEVSDFIRFMLNDPHTWVISLFLETIRRPEEFLKAADLALERGKPLICLKIGKAEVGARAAASHTGALTGSDEIYEAIFRKKGITRVEALEDLFETASLFEKYPPPRGRRIGILTTTGGGAMLLADECGALGLDFPKPSGQTLEALGEGLPSFAAFSNPLDVTGSGVGGGYERTLNLFLKDEQFDVVVSVVGTSSQFAPEMGVKPILRREKGGEKPLVAFLNPNAQDAARLLERDGIPTFRTPEGCARGLKYFCDWGKFLENRELLSKSPETSPPQGNHGEIDGILTGSPSSLNEFESKRLLRLYGIPTAQEGLAHSPEEAVRIARDIGYPVVLKVCSSDILHKTEAGVVRIGVESEAGIREAFEEILSRSRRYKPGANIAGVLVQEMVRGGQEVIVGMSRDRAFGPILIFGMGGIFVELLGDISMRIPPLTRSEAEEMVLEVKTAPLLTGYRGGKSRDIEALVDAILRFSRFSTDLGAKLKTAEINPLMVLEKGKGVKAVDALVVKADGNVTSST